MLRKFIIILIIGIIYILTGLIYIHKLLPLSPWIGADTYPVYPRTLKDLIIIYLSPWSFYFSRTVISSEIPYFSIIKQVFLIIFGKYSEAALVVLWFLIMGLGFFALSKFITSKTSIRVLSGIIYAISAFTWHESVHSIYGMMGAYALTPWVTYMLIKYLYYIEKSKSTGSSTIVTIIFKTSFLGLILGVFIGLLMISTLYPYYSIFFLFIWLPMMITLLVLIIIDIGEASTARNVLIALVALIIVAIGFLIPYYISYKGTILSSIESQGLRNPEDLLKVKMADFSYNYRFNNLPLALWFSYLWAPAWGTLNKALPTIPIFIIASIATTNILMIAKRRNKHYSQFMTLYSIIGFLAVIGYLMVASDIARNPEVLEMLWQNPLVSTLLSGITQPIKIGIPVSLYLTLMTTIMLSHLSSLFKNLRKTRRVLQLAFGGIVLGIVMVSALLYSIHLPVTENHNVSQQYEESLKLLIDTQESFGYSTAFIPYIWIAKGKGYLRYYYTYAVALRPFEVFGPYVKHSAEIEKIQDILATDRVEVSVIAKTLYIQALVDKNRRIHLYNFTWSPVYIVLPITIEPYNEACYIKGLEVLSKLIAEDKTLAQLYLRSYTVIDFVPPNSLRSATYPIYIIKFNEKCSIKNSWNISIIKKQDGMTRNISTEEFLDDIRDLLFQLRTTYIKFKIDYLPFNVQILIEPDKHVLSVIRYNERQSPYWASNDLEKMDSLSLYNLFRIKNNSTTINIYHELWLLKLSLIMLKVLMFPGGIYLVIII
ncbi:hypothetical protein APE_1187.1 [Aeropyrum pernix K1]|uniref:Uncharacterized protein n=1 Tax=Aeropyrum pernix (strain ATCC 700893 / DSM 11879 / JCM 9820 / NBRC 100138 / K1) TaxID=272557 RepID=Q9YCS4_AERPE|nr:hypothetical protein [Aeropyrum pernix]BAA80173.2 hypothetical protein APE_1187.1 [Aeropyrum pernix K1]